MRKIVIVLGALALAAPAFAGEKEADKSADAKKPAAPAKKADEKAPAKAGEKPSDGKAEEKPAEK
jgi:hypothetical protein